jgi:drug/metabolite transporter (DMT)-like permease
MTLQTFSQNPALRGASLIVLSGALFALVNILVQHLAMVGGLEPSLVAFWQYMFALLFALPWLFSMGWTALRTDVLLQHVLRVGLAAIGVQLWAHGLAYVPIWQAIALVMLSPFFVTLGAGIFLSERVTAARWGTVSIGFIGGMLILAPWSEAFDYFLLFPVGAAIFWAGSSVLTKRMSRSQAPETLTAYLLLLLTPINAALAAGDGLFLGFGETGLLLGIVGVLTAAAQFALVSAYRMADASFLQPFDHVKLPFNVVLGLAVFGYVPPGTMWLGSLLIVGASLYLVWSERRDGS